MSIQEKIQNQELIIGSWVQSGSPVVAEVLADYSFDFITADMEHSDMNEEAFSHFVRAIQHKASPFARVRANDEIAIRRLLDIGAHGIIVPLINNADEAKKAVQAAYYPPQGIRGYAFCQANGWGKTFDEYAADFNKEVSLFVMIETKSGVENIDEILQVPGVDGTLVGPYDLSGSYGVVGQLDHPEVIEAKDKVLAACKRHGKVAGEHIVTPTKEQVQKSIALGYRFLALGMDTVFIAQQAEKTSNMVSNMVPKTMMKKAKEV